MILTSVLVPLSDNDGNPFSRGAFRDFEEMLLDRFGGWTDSGIKGGAWRDEGGTSYRDQLRQYDISLQSWREVPAFLEVVEFVAVHFRQLAVFYTIAGIPDIMPGPPL
jgi:hypothetical protein